MAGTMCRVCGGAAGAVYQWLGFDWVRCDDCGCTQKSLDKAGYESLAPTYDAGTIVEGTADTAAVQHALGVTEKVRMLDRLGMPVASRLLDIGCGAGGFLLAARQLGFDATGVEPSVAHSQIARETFGLSVLTGYFDPSHFTQQFDIVVLSHVIEHILEPREFLSDIGKVLRPGGLLLMITPNVDSLAAATCGKYWSMYKPVDHVTMIGKRSLPYCVPEEFQLKSAVTSEWPGEFAAHVISALKQWRSPRVGNVAARNHEGVSTRRETLPLAVRGLLALASLPFYALGAVLRRQSCLTAVLLKRGGTFG